MTGQPTDKNAAIFDIQSFTVHDGPGIRTTIFFKGCPLNCLWCHNPESKNKNSQIMFYKNLCTACMLCVNACGSGAQIISSDGTHNMLRENCKCCGSCLKVCCYDALKLCGKTYTVHELYEKIQSDIRFIKENGGITFSGGEPLTQADFIKDFCGLIPGIHTALETSGYANKEQLEKIIDCIDLFLFDIKIINNAEHKKYCKVDNELILSNLEYLYGKEKEIIIRLPIIPGINDTSLHFDAVSELLKKYPKIKKAEIMPYNNYGIAKMEALSIEIPKELPRVNPKKETVNKWLDELKKRGCGNVIISE